MIKTACKTHLSCDDKKIYTRIIKSAPRHLKSSPRGIVDGQEMSK